MLNLRRGLTAGVILFSLTVAVAAVPTHSERAGARSWAAALSSTDSARYTQVEVLSRLPPSYRTGLYQTLPSGEARATFWHNVFANYRQQHSITDQQDAALRRAEMLLTPQFFESKLPAYGAKLAAVKAARADVEKVLGNTAAMELFMYAGSGAGSVAALPAVERALYHWRAGGSHRRLTDALSMIVPVLQARSCNCLSQSECDYETVCGNPVNGPCEATEYGCGDWWLSGCGSILLSNIAPIAPQACTGPRLGI